MDFLFQHSRECILELSSDKPTGTVSVVRMNSAAESMLGVSGEKDPVAAAGDLLAGHGGSALEKAMDAVLAGAASEAFALFMPLGEGGDALDMTATLGRGLDERLYLVIHPSGTAATQAVLKKKDIGEVSDEYLANVGHELRTPMNSILGFAELLADMDLTEEQLAYVKLLRQSGGELLVLINNILDYSKAAANRLKVDPIEVDLRVLVEDVAYTLAIQAEQKGIELACHVDGAIPRNVAVDPQYLRQILNNLAGNAIKFTPKGEVVIEVRLGLAAEEADSSGDEMWLNFSISDTGIGIPADRLESIFERFTQADDRIQRRFGGTGLGLTISRQLVDLMGGDIQVESDPGHGSTFRFSIPVKPGTRKPEVEKIKDAYDITGKHILVADANTTYRRILLKMLITFGCHPVAVADGKAALEALQNPAAHTVFDAVIMDLTLPDLSGPALVKAIQADESIKDTRIIVLTSMTRRRQAKEMADLGCHGYLTKPVRQSVLHDVIGEVLSGAGKPEAARPLITRHSVAENQYKGIRVLLAEDNEVSAQMARRLLKNDGYSVVVVSDGTKALRSYQREEFDLIIMDVQMPEMDGFEATREIRRLEADANANDRRKGPIPIVGLTASARKADWDRCLTAGMDACATKPIHPRDLLELVEGLLQKRIDSKRSDQEPDGVAAPIDAGQALEQAIGDRVFLNELVNVFIASVETQIQEMEAALDAGHLDIVVDTAHRICGAAGNLFAGEIYDVVCRLEDMAKAGSFKDVKRMLAELVKAIGRLRDYTADGRWMDGQ